MAPQNKGISCFWYEDPLRSVRSMSNQFNEDGTTSDLDRDLGPRVMMVRELEANQDSSLDDESEEDEDDRWRELVRGQDVPSDYWHIQKLIKYMKVQ